MVTRNLRYISATVLQSSATARGSLPIIGVDGKISYLSRTFTKFPTARTETFTSTANAAGISFGTGGTAATELDANLEETITSGIAVSLMDKTPGCDAPYNPYILYRFNIANNKAEALVIREVGYKQTVSAASSPGRDESVDTVALMDRTVLSVPLVIQAGDAGVLEYKLCTHGMPDLQKGGVDLVSFTWGSDAQVADLIDAADAGLVDLQTDAGWQVGDMRKIHIDAFTADGYSIPAQDVDIVISSFQDYNSCGCLFQFDFVESLSVGCRMNSSNTTTGGYGATNMKTITLPALVQALPTWIQDRLCTFSVVATAGGNSSSIETVTGNKLALRSEYEIFGTVTKAKAQEGNQIDLYKMSTSYRFKKTGWSGSNGAWWERSPNSGAAFCFVNSNGNANYGNASTAYGVAPFGCIKSST